MVSREISLDEALFILSTYKLGQGILGIEDQSRARESFELN